METLAKATGANIVTNLDELTDDELGHAGIVEEKNSWRRNDIRT